MVLTSKTKRLLCIFIPVGIAAVAAVVLAVLALGGGFQSKPFDIQRNQEGTITACTLKNGASPLSPPAGALDCYSFTPPEEWSQIQDAMDTADQSSQSYQDVYQNQSGATLTFSQQIAWEDFTVASIGETREVEFGDLQVIYCREGGATESAATSVYWVHGDSLLSLSCTQDMEINQMLDLIHRVDYTALRVPELSQLSLRPGGVTVSQNGNAVSRQITYYRTVGNPEIPAGLSPYSFAQTPDGFRKLEDVDLPQGGALYVNDDWQILYLEWTPGADEFFDSEISYRQYTIPAVGGNYLEENPDQVQQIDLDGKPGYLILDQGASQLGWIDGCCTLQLRTNRTMTQEEMFALARTVAQGE